MPLDDLDRITLRPTANDFLFVGTVAIIHQNDGAIGKPIPKQWLRWIARYGVGLKRGAIHNQKIDVFRD